MLVAIAKVNLRLVREGVKQQLSPRAHDGCLRILVFQAETVTAKVIVFRVTQFFYKHEDEYVDVVCTSLFLEFHSWIDSRKAQGEI